MKKYCIVFFYIIIFKAFTSFAQDSLANQTKDLYMISRSYGDSIVLRWAPSTANHWQIANHYGYKLQRRQLTQATYKDIGERTFRPYSLSEWKSKFDTTDVFVATAAQTIYGKFDINKPLDYQGPMAQLYMASQELQVRYGFALMSADFSSQAAEGLGLGFVDKDIEKGKTYVYRLFINDPSGERQLDTITHIVRTSYIYEPKPVMHVTAKEGDHNITLLWNKPINSASFSGYDVERSEDGQNFTKLNEYILRFDAGNDQSANCVYLDTLVENYKPYYYRVIGHTSFGDVGKPSEVIKIMARDLNGPIPPHTIKAEEFEAGKIKITWEADTRTSDHNGFYVGKSISATGPFAKLNEKPLPLDATSFIDEEPVSIFTNYYTLFAVDTAGNENMGPIVSVILVDSIPPAQPENLVGSIDSTGVVSLAWNLGPEQDLQGYRVYKANARNRDFIQLTSAPVSGNFYMDKVALNTLTENIYYKIVAVDLNYNPSPYSEILELKRPDTIPPTQPLITGFKVLDKSIHLTWENSKSEDIFQHILYRKQEGGDWEKIMSYGDSTSQYSDTNVKLGRNYAYALESIDDDGLSSGLTPPFHVNAIDRGLRPAVNDLKGTFNKKDQTLSLTWTYPGEGEYKFMILKGENSEKLAAYKAIEQGTTQFEDKEFYYKDGQQGVNYAIKVIYNDGGESTLSNLVQINFKQ